MSIATSQTHPAAQQRAALALPAVLTVGLFLVWGTGFASPEILHNAAHDARHAMSFPCH